MKELKYGRQMRDRTLGNGDTIRWIFPENIHINDDILYEVECQENVSSDPSDFSILYKVIYIKPVSELIEHLQYIINTYKEMKQIDSFEKWFKEHYKLTVK